MSAPSTYPLAWPMGQPRVAPGARAKAGGPHITRTMAELWDSFGLFGEETKAPVTDIVVSSNVTLGNPRPADPGVAVYFQWGGEPYCIAIDHLSTPEANLRAVYYFVERCRGLLLTSGGFPIGLVLKGFRVPETAEVA